MYLATRKIKKGFREMQSKMQEQQMNQQNGFDKQTSTPQPQPKTKAGDYIDFEEVRL